VTSIDTDSTIRSRSNRSVGDVVGDVGDVVTVSRRFPKPTAPSDPNPFRETALSRSATPSARNASSTRARYASFASCERDAAKRELVEAFWSATTSDAPWCIDGSSMPEESHSFRGADREGARRSAAENSLGGEARRDALDSRSSSLRDMVVQRSGEANSSDTHRETGKDVDEIREELMRRVSRSGGRAYPSSSPPRRRDRDAFRRASADERASFMPEALTGLAREVATETKWQSRRFYRSVRHFSRMDAFALEDAISACAR
jgi:hypothetical protein